MKKLIFILLFAICTHFSYAQSVTILPENENNLTLYESNMGMGSTAMDARYNIRTTKKDAFLGTITNFPLSLGAKNQTFLRLLPNGDLGLGSISDWNWTGTTNSSGNLILSKFHVKGSSSSDRAFNFSPIGYRVKSAILGQTEKSTHTDNYNYAGIIGTTDGYNGNGSAYNIGVLAIASTNEAAEGQTYNFYGINKISTNKVAYGIFNEVSSSNIGIIYGNFNKVTRTGFTGNVHGTYNEVTGNNASNVYGEFNSISGNKNIYGIKNRLTKSEGGSDAYGIRSELTIDNGANAYGSSILINNMYSSAAEVYGQHIEVNNSNPVYKDGYGVYSTINGSTQSGKNYALYGEVIDGGGTEFYAVYGKADTKPYAWAGFFEGNVTVTGHLDVTGSLSKLGGSFKIDHPLDPENKYLYHSFVESPDMMNIYNGNVVTDENGYATIELPAYFNALNRDFRYQLTSMGEWTETWIAEEINENNQFKIGTKKPLSKVSWQITGIRKDIYAEENRIIPEVEKPEHEKGTYLYIAGFTKSSENILEED